MNVNQFTWTFEFFPINEKINDTFCIDFVRSGVKPKKITTINQLSVSIE